MFSPSNCHNLCRCASTRLGAASVVRNVGGHFRKGGASASDPFKDVATRVVRRRESSSNSSRSEGVISILSATQMAGSSHLKG